MLMPDLKEQRMWAYTDFLEQYEAVGNDFLDSMITRDKTYITTKLSESSSL
jgi:hypothetical protein